MTSAVMMRKIREKLILKLNYDSLMKLLEEINFFSEKIILNLKPL